MATREPLDNTNTKPLLSHGTLALVMTLIAFAVFSRLLPHPPNIAPVAAVAIFAGSLLPRGYALSLPVIIMVISDLIIGLHPTIVYTWGSFVLIALMSGKLLNKRLKPWPILGMSLAASALFYLITNFGVWTEGRLYPATLAGLMDCYYMALPFLRNTLVGDLVYTGALFGLYAVARQTLLARSQTLRALKS